MREATVLELRGALDILSSAQSKLRMSGWEGATYYTAPKATNDAWSILSTAMCSVRSELSWIAGNSKEYRQSAVLGRI